MTTTQSKTASDTAYRIGTISVNADGVWWVHWYGEHVQQGGVSFGAGNQGSTDIAFLLKKVAKNMAKCKPQYVEAIERLEAKKAAEPEQPATEPTE